MAYNLGVVGIGHWFERLYAGMQKNGEIKLVKAASASGLEKKKEQLDRLGIPDGSYYQIPGSEALPEDFFDGLDVVHISDPNEFHAAQTMQSLSKGKITITEKTWGVDRKEFEGVVNYITENHMEEKTYLHLHYLHKLLTIELPELLEGFVGKYGKVTGTSATFFEVESPSDKRRSRWLFSRGNGGLFMDWIHPFEVYYRGAWASKMNLEDLFIFAVNEDYDSEHPTGIHAVVELGGKYFKDGARAQIRIAKGLQHEHHNKESMKFVFESGHYLDLNFLHAEVEFVSEMRGSWELHDSEGKLIDSGAPRGPTSSDILVQDIISLCNGKNLGFTTRDLQVLFEPQWKYQEMVGSRKLIKDMPSIAKFVAEGIENKV